MSIAGDVHSLGRLVLTELSGKDRWTVIVGGQSRWFDPDPTADLFYEAEDLTLLSTSTKTAGAAGASGSGANKVVRNTDLTTTYQAVLKSTVASVGLTHKDTYRVWGRLYRPTGNTGAVSVRLEWSEGDYLRVTQNDPVGYAADDREGVFTWANLGIVSIDPASSRWEFRLLAKSTVAGDEVDVDCFVLFPTEVVYTELSGRLQFQTPSSFLDRDEFDQSPGSLAGKTSSGGKTWTEAGDAVRFTVETAGHTAQRTELSDADENTGAYAVSGTSAFAAQAAQVDFKRTAISDGQRQAVLARYTDTNNWVRAGVRYQGGVGEAVRVDKRVAGTVTVLAEVAVSRLPFDTWHLLRLHVDAAGRWYVWLLGQGGFSPTPLLRGQDDALATGGALASGKPGFYDVHGDVANPSTRNYDNFFAFAPTADAALFANQTLELRHDSAKREPSGGGDLTTVSDRRGRYLKIPPGGPEGRSTRLAILALPNDPYTMGDLPATYDVSLQLYVTKRGLGVPEA